MSTAPQRGDWITILDPDTGEAEYTGTYDGPCFLVARCLVVDIYPDYGPNEDGYVHTDECPWRPATHEEIERHKALPPRPSDEEDE